MTKADKEREVMDRCYKVDIGDRVEIDTHDEGTVQGEVTNMLWRGELGFRQPDALEVQWTGSRGELQMGKIEMWEQWRKVGKGQEGEGREVKHADLSTVANETDAATRGGLAGEDRDSAAKSDRQLGEQVTVLETLSSSGSNEVLMRPNGRGTRSGRTGTYVRMQGGVLRQKITEQAPGGAAKADRWFGGQATGLETLSSSGSNEVLAGPNGQGTRSGRTRTHVRRAAYLGRENRSRRQGQGRVREMKRRK